MKLSYDASAVERGAKALWNRGRAGFWEEAPESAREHYRAEARDVLEAALAAAGTESLYGHKPGCPPAPAACICASGTEPTLTDEQIDAINSIEFRNHIHAALSAFVEIVIENKGNWFDSSGRNLVDAILRNARKPLALALFRAPSEAKPIAEGDKYLAAQCLALACAFDAGGSITPMMRGETTRLLRDVSARIHKNQ